MAFESNVSEYTAEGAPGGFAICQNGMALNTPAGAPLVVPTMTLAETIVEEGHRARIIKRDPMRMPLMQMALTAIDVIATAREETIDEIMTYVDGELLCHRAAEPRGLVKEQEKNWQPLLDWFAKRFKAPLTCAAGVMPIQQPPESVEAIRSALSRCSEFYLIGLSQAVATSGSLVLGLAMATVYVTPDQVFKLAELDADFQAKNWGDDPESDVRRDSIRQELKICGQWFTALNAKAVRGGSTPYM